MQMMRPSGVRFGISTAQRQYLNNLQKNPYARLNLTLAAKWLADVRSGQPLPQTVSSRAQMEEQLVAALTERLNKEDFTELRRTPEFVDFHKALMAAYPGNDAIPEALFDAYVKARRTLLGDEADWKRYLPLPE